MPEVWRVRLGQVGDRIVHWVLHHPARRGWRACSRKIKQAWRSLSATTLLYKSTGLLCQCEHDQNDCSHAFPLEHVLTGKYVAHQGPVRAVDQEGVTQPRSAINRSYRKPSFKFFFKKSVARIFHENAEKSMQKIKSSCSILEIEFLRRV